MGRNDVWKSYPDSQSRREGATDWVLPSALFVLWSDPAVSALIGLSKGGQWTEKFPAAAHGPGPCSWPQWAPEDEAL